MTFHDYKLGDDGTLEYTVTMKAGDLDALAHLAGAARVYATMFPGTQSLTSDVTFGDLLQSATRLFRFCNALSYDAPHPGLAEALDLHSRED